MSGEEQFPDNKTVLREALQAVSVSGRKAPATEEVRRRPCSAVAAVCLDQSFALAVCTGQCDARLLGHAARPEPVRINRRYRRRGHGRASRVEAAPRG